MLKIRNMHGMFTILFVLLIAVGIILIALFLYAIMGGCMKWGEKFGRYGNISACCLEYKGFKIPEWLQNCRPKGTLS